ncbi:MAG TPA: hypothetical protein VFH04_04200 [Nitrososphaeraceae archaeon]|nr:hypothetical protein [Nitrososphaeraceae archaeon]
MGDKNLLYLLCLLSDHDFSGPYLSLHTTQSTIGHPSPDKWIPLEYIDNVKTNQAHNCPKRSNGGGSSSFSKQQQQAQEATDVILQVKLLHQKLDTLIEMLGQKQKESKS